MLKSIRCFALVTMLAPGWAHADLRNFVDVCGNPETPALDVVTMCQRALDTGKLGPTAAAQVRANLGIGFHELGQFEDAVAEFTRALETAPRMIDLYVNRARSYEKLRRLSEAAADYNEAIRIDQTSADAYLNRGVMLLNNGDPARAAQDFSIVIELQPQWISPYFNRGVALFNLGEMVSADQDFSVVIQRSPRDAAAYLNRGRVRAAIGRADAGIDFDRALEIDPEWGGGWFARGQYYDTLGNREAANQDFVRAYELGYPDPWLLRRIREISG